MQAKRKRSCAIFLAVMLLAAPCSTALMEEPVGSETANIEAAAPSRETLSEDDLNAILRAGVSTTSDSAEKPWYFVAITNREILAALADDDAAEALGGAQSTEGSIADEDIPQEAKDVLAEAEKQVLESKAMLDDAQAAIIIYRDAASTSVNADVDCGLACQNMAHAAEALGYSTQTLLAAAVALNGENHALLCERFEIDASMQAEAVLLIDCPDAGADADNDDQIEELLNARVRYVQ